MSGKQAKRTRRAVRKEAAKIKVQGLQEFIDYAQTQSLFRRIVFAIRLILKMMKV